MAQVMTPSMVRQIGSLFEGGSVAGLSDRHLIERFVNRRDPTGEAAFAALVARHGPMVLGVCRQLLGDRHHAEDAFQAVFLVLARKAGSLRDPDLLGNWLYGVALRTARKARVRRARRRRGEEDGSSRHPGPSSTVPAEQPILAREQAEALHEEIDRLPACLPPAGRALLLRGAHAGRGGASAPLARRDRRQPAGPGAGQAPSRPHPTRRRLARRRAGRGAGVQARLGVGLIPPVRHHDPGRDRFRGRTGRLRHSATALAREVLRSMLIHKLKFIALTVLFLGSIATGAGYLTPAPGDEGRARRGGNGSPAAAGRDRSRRCGQDRPRAG